MVSTRNATRDLGLGRGDAALLPVAAGLRRDGAPRPRRQRYAVGGGRPVQLAGALAVLGVAAAGGEPEAQPDGRGEPAQGTGRPAAERPGQRGLGVGADRGVGEGGAGEVAGLLNNEPAGDRVQHRHSSSLLHYYGSSLDIMTLPR